MISIAKSKHHFSAKPIHSFGSPSSASTVAPPTLVLKAVRMKNSKPPLAFSLKAFAHRPASTPKKIQPKNKD
jgi:hypothetical protein